jgi:CubicO group peptidase (beta-lactamase class C family)
MTPFNQGFRMINRVRHTVVGLLECLPFTTARFAAYPNLLKVFISVDVEKSLSRAFHRCLRDLAFSLALALMLALASPWLSEAAQDDTVDDYINGQLQQQRIAGLSLAIVREGRVVKARGYGLANLETQTPATAETVYKIGSVSKSILAVGIMLLVEDSRVGLDDTIDRFLQDVPDSWKSITVRHLLTHTAGIVENPPGFLPFTQQPDLEVIQSLYPVPLLFPPGDRWNYSNATYFILGEIIHLASGMPWPDFVESRIFRPLNMGSTRITSTSEVIAGRANGYIWSRGRFVRAEDWVAVRPSGAFLSTVNDLARWENALRSRALLTHESWEQVLAPVRLNGGQTHPYGFGFFLDPWQGRQRIYHDGQLPGFRTMFEEFPEEGIAILLAANTDEIDIGKLAHSIAGFYAPQLSPPVYNTIPDRNPEVTAKAWRFVNGFISDELDPSLFPNGAQFTPEMRTMLGGRLRKWGTVEAISLVEREPDGDFMAYRYRISYPDAASLLLKLFLDADGIIRGWAYETDTAP